MCVCVCVCFVANCTPLLIQQNYGWSGSMNRSWAEYKVGFGDPSDNYWLGNDLLSQLTAKYRYKLRFDLLSHNTGNWYYAEHSTFRVLSEAYNYKLLVGGFSGNASFDAFNAYHNGAQFSTFDGDNDLWLSGNCAASHGNGFWWRRPSCGYCRVNAARGNFYWNGLPGGRNLQLSRMWLQCK